MLQLKLSYVVGCVIIGYCFRKHGERVRNDLTVKSMYIVYTRVGGSGLERSIKCTYAATIRLNAI